MRAGSLAGGGRLAGKPEARHRRNHQMKSVRCVRPMYSGISQRIDNLHLFDDRAGPSMRDDEWQRIFMFRMNVNEMNIQSIDLGYELRQGFQFRLAFAPRS